MIYILAVDAIDATVFASSVLRISAAEMTSRCTAVVGMAQVPHSCRQLDIRATPQFFERMMTQGERDENGWHGPTPPRQMERVEAREIVAARGIRTAVRMRGGEIVPPYDVPPAMDPDSIEAWLATD